MGIDHVTDPYLYPDIYQKMIPNFYNICKEDRGSPKPHENYSQANTKNSFQYRKLKVYIGKFSLQVMCIYFFTNLSKKKPFKLII